jgi:hypothetical protein
MSSIAFSALKLQGIFIHMVSPVAIAEFKLMMMCLFYADRPENICDGLQYQILVHRVERYRDVCRYISKECCRTHMRLMLFKNEEKMPILDGQ